MRELPIINEGLVLKKIPVSPNNDYMAGNDGRVYSHDKWFWLKPVIDKIFTMALDYPEQVKPITDMRIVVNIGQAYERVYEFAVWYKENVKNRSWN